MRGEARAEAHANRLTRETGVRHFTVTCFAAYLVGGAHWIEVCRRRWRRIPLIHVCVARYDPFDGALL